GEIQPCHHEMASGIGGHCGGPLMAGDHMVHAQRSAHRVAAGKILLRDDVARTNEELTEIVALPDDHEVAAGQGCYGGKGVGIAGISCHSEHVADRHSSAVVAPPDDLAHEKRDPSPYHHEAPL